MFARKIFVGPKNFLQLLTADTTPLTKLTFISLTAEQGTRRKIEVVGQLTGDERRLVIPSLTGALRGCRHMHNNATAPNERSGLNAYSQHPGDGIDCRPCSFELQFMN